MPDGAVRDPDSLVRDPDSLVRDPDGLVRDPDSLVRDPDSLSLKHGRDHVAVRIQVLSPDGMDTLRGQGLLAQASCAGLGLLAWRAA